jgi:hypothetical protein
MAKIIRNERKKKHFKSKIFRVRLTKSGDTNEELIRYRKMATRFHLPKPASTVKKETQKVPHFIIFIFIWNDYYMDERI